MPYSDFHQRSPEKINFHRSQSVEFYVCLPPIRSLFFNTLIYNIFFKNTELRNCNIANIGEGENENK